MELPQRINEDFERRMKMKRIVCINCFKGALLSVAGIGAISAEAVELHLRSGESAIISAEGWRTKATVWLDAHNDASFT